MQADPHGCPRPSIKHPHVTSARVPCRRLKCKQPLRTRAPETRCPPRTPHPRCLSGVLRRHRWAHGFGFQPSGVRRTQAGDTGGVALSLRRRSSSGRVLLADPLESLEPTGMAGPALPPRPSARPLSQETDCALSSGALTPSGDTDVPIRERSQLPNVFRADRTGFDHELETTRHPSTQDVCGLHGSVPSGSPWLLLAERGVSGTPSPGPRERSRGP